MIGAVAKNPVLFHLIDVPAKNVMRVQKPVETHYESDFAFFSLKSILKSPEVIESQI